MRASNRITPQTAGIFLAIASTLIFSVQDGISKYLAQNYDVISVVMFRYWAFAVFVFALSARQKNGFRTPFRSTQLPIQFFRGVLLVMQVCLIIWCFANIGLINTHVMFASFPADCQRTFNTLARRKGRLATLAGHYLRFYWRSHYPAAGQQCFRAAIVITRFSRQQPLPAITF